MSSAYDRAEAFAARWHAGQVDKAGRDYLLHLQDVAAKLVQHFPDASDEEVQAALLHDVLEDTACAPHDIRECFGSRVLAIVAALTKPPGRAYLDVIRDIAAAGDLSVLRVKLADNLSNSDPSRVFAGFDDKVATKYAPARAILEQALAKA